MNYARAYALELLSEVIIDMVSKLFFFFLEQDMVSKLQWLSGTKWSGIQFLLIA